MKPTFRATATFTLKELHSFIADAFEAPPGYEVEKVEIDAGLDYGWQDRGPGSPICTGATVHLKRKEGA